MAVFAQVIKTASVVTISLMLAACSKKEESPVPTDPTETAHTVPRNEADCDNLPNPKPLDDSAAGRSRAVSEGMAARDICKKAMTNQKETSHADLARIREIKEKEQADRSASKQSEEEWKKGMKEGGSRPLQGLKY